jgi:hypothetical protein
MTRTLIDPKFRNFIREKPCIVAVALDRVDECSNVVEACHNKHSGMGGRKPTGRNTILTSMVPVSSWPPNTNSASASLRNRGASRYPTYDCPYYAD